MSPDDVRAVLLQVAAQLTPEQILELSNQFIQASKAAAAEWLRSEAGDERGVDALLEAADRLDAMPWERFGLLVTARMKAASESNKPKE